MAGAFKASEFDRAAVRFRLFDKAVSVARAVLVDGASFEHLCEDYDTSHHSHTSGPPRLAKRSGLRVG